MNTLSRLLFSTLATLAFTASAQAESVKEKETGFRFATTLQAPNGATHELLGVGVRQKTMFNVNVYGAGIYIDGNQARKKLGFKSVPSQSEYDKIADANLDKTLRMVMARDVDAEDMRDAFDESLGPRVEVAAKRGMKGGKAALGTFKGFFKLGALKEKSELVFSCTDGTMRTKVQGKKQPDIKSKALCWALFDTYLGRDPIGGDLKKNLVRRIASIMNKAGPSKGPPSKSASP